MGGRGASSGTYKLYGKTLQYGDEYRSLATLQTTRGEVKVIVGKLANNNKPPMETRTEGRINAQVDDTGHVSSLYFFGADGKRVESWNIATHRDSHRHYGSGSHKHIGYNHSENGGRRLNKQERRYAREVDRKWRRSKSGRGFGENST